MDDQIGKALRPGALRELGAIELMRLGLPGPITQRVRGGERLRRTLVGAGLVAPAYVFHERTEGVFDPSIRSLGRRTLLAGYFQNERYFEHVRPQVRAAFAPASSAVEAWFHRVVSATHGRPLVAIGVRSGPDYARLGWTLPRSYYADALNLLPSPPDEFAYATFGDDEASNVALVRALLGEKVQIYSAHQLAPVDQLNAMSLFDRLIIPNSTFSWWGAWLAEFDHKGEVCIVAPDPWLSPKMRTVPERWVSVLRASDVSEL